MRTVGICTSSRSERHLMEAVVTECNSGKYDLEASLVHVPTLDYMHTLFSKNLNLGGYDIFVVPADRSEMVYMAARLFHNNKAFAHYFAGSKTYSHTHDDVNRWLISLMANFCFAESPEAADNLKRAGMPADRVLVTGTSHFDGITMGDILANQPADAPAQPYVLYLLNPETLKSEQFANPEMLGGLDGVVICPNEDASTRVGKQYTHLEFLWLLHHATYFVSNSSAALYELPFLQKFYGSKCRHVQVTQRNAVRTPVPVDLCRGASRCIAEWCERVDLDWLRSPERPHMHATP